VPRSRPSTLPAEAQLDLALVGANVVTMDAARPRARAVGVAHGRVVVVGEDADVLALVGPGTARHELRGKTVLPGFVESHNHMQMYGLFRTCVDCGTPPNASITDIQDRIRERARETPKGEWIVGWRYDDTLLREMRHPDRHDLDAVAPDHPVFLWHVSAHINVASTRALVMAGITRDTPDHHKGYHGRIVKDPRTGEPTGVLEERGARNRVSELIPRHTVEDLRRGLALVGPEYLAAGVTSIHDAGVGVFAGARELTSYQQAASEGALPVRVHMMMRQELFTGFLDGDESRDLGLRTGFGDEWLRMGPIKITHDGSIQGLTGALREPYHCDPSRSGFLLLDQETLERRVLAAHRAGYAVAIHTNGDAAIESALVAYEQAQAACPRPDVRHRLEHCQMASDAQLDRIAALGLGVSFFVKHVYYWGDRHRAIFLGPERARRIDPLRSACDRGVRFGLHADTPVTPIEPLLGIWAAVTRLTSGGDVLGPEQRIDATEAVRAYTIDAAWLAHEEGEKGSLTPGKLADAVVLAEDPTAVAPERIRDIAVEATIVGGRVVHGRLGGS
jgi:predicted amidohydrolase YtcJ